MTEAPLHTTLDWQERALHYGDGLFETIRKTAGVLPLWPGHYRRLSTGCQRLEIPVPDETWLLQQIEEASAQSADAVIKVIVSRGRGGRGLTLPEVEQASVFVFCYPPPDDLTRGWRVALCRTRLPVNPNLAGLKHLNRLDYVLAAVELHRRGNFDEGLLCDGDGYLIEGLISNLFLVRDQILYTPLLDRCGVAGVMRAQVFEYCQQQGIKVCEKRLREDLLLSTSECFLANSVRGIVPVVELDGRVCEVGDMTRMLASALNPQLSLS